MGEKTKTTRRGFLGYAGSAVVGAAIGAAAGYAVYPSVNPPPPPPPPPPKPEKIAGATQAERAINGVLKLKQDGKVPSGTKITIMTFAGTTGSFTSVQQQWESLTGIPLEVEAVPIEVSGDRIRLETVNKTGRWDVFHGDYRLRGDLAAAEGIVNMDEFVEKYRPVIRGKPDGYIYPYDKQINEYLGSIYSFGFDGDTFIAVYRKDLMDDRTEKENFERQYGYPLRVPDTWKQHRDLMEFFHRPAQKLYGNYEYRSLFWGYRSWVMRFASQKWPSMLYFDDDMNPQVNTPEGIRATKDYVETVKFGDPELTTLTWAEIYPRYAAGQGFTSINFPSFTKFTNTPAVSKVVGKLTYALPPGTEVDSPLGKVLLRRNTHEGTSVLYVSNYSKNKELAYLFCQWIASPENIPIVSTDPASFTDISRYNQLLDPRVRATFHPQVMDIYERASEILVGFLAIPGTDDYMSKLDRNLHRAAIGEISPETAMATTEREWNVITDRIGRAKQKQAWAWFKTTFPVGTV